MSNKRDIDTIINGLDAMMNTLTSFKRQLTELKVPQPQLVEPHFEHAEVAMVILEALGFSKTKEIQKPEEIKEVKAWEAKVLDPVVEILTKLYQEEPGFLKPVSTRNGGSPEDCFRKNIYRHLGRNLAHCSYLQDPDTDNLIMDFRYRSNGKDYLWWSICQSKTIQNLFSKKESVPVPL